MISTEKPPKEFSAFVIITHASCQASVNGRNNISLQMFIKIAFVTHIVVKGFIFRFILATRFK